MDDGSIEYETRQSEDGAWRIHTTELKGEVTHRGILAKTFDTEAEAVAHIDGLVCR